MELKLFIKKLFDGAKAKGILDCEAYYSDGESFRVNVYKGEIDQYSVSSYIGLGFRGIYNDNMGYSYTEVLDDGALTLLIDGVINNAKVITSDEKDVIFEGSREYSDFLGFSESLNKITVDDKINLAKELEKKAYDISDKVKTVKNSTVVSGSNTNRIINSKGLDLSYKSNFIYTFLSVVVEDRGDTQNAYSFCIEDSIDKIKIEELCTEAVNKALSYIGGESIESNKYKVILKNEVAADILETFWGVFSAYNVQKGLSLLGNKLNEKIASDIVTIIDDPLYKDGVASCPFDATGVATYKKEIISDGKLNTYLYNLKTGARDNAATTANASRASFSSIVGTAPFNFYIKRGEYSFDNLLKELRDGVLITEVQGLHSGANTISGDFTLAAKGFEIKNGSIVRPVSQITIGGNFYKLLENISSVGSDLIFGLPSGDSAFGSPSLIVEDITVSGK